MKLYFAVALVGSALGTALPAFADEAATAASSTQDAIAADLDGPTGHPAIKDHHPKRPKKQHPKTPEEASGKSAPSDVSEAKQDPPASGDTNDSNNAANSPTEPRLTFQYWNYYAPLLHDNSNWAEDGTGRILNSLPGRRHPADLSRGPDGGHRPEFDHWAAYRVRRPATLQFLTDQVRPSRVSGAHRRRRLMAFPTVNSPNFGPDNTVQGGAAGVLEARLNWGILGALATYQHTLSGAGSQLIAVQPILYYNFQHGWYFRSELSCSSTLTATPT